MSDGDLYVLDSDYNLKKSFSYLGVDKIESCVTHEGLEDISFFCSYVDESSLGVLDFKYNSNGAPEYIDYYSLSETSNYIDMEIEDGIIYIATDDGIYIADINSNLKLPSSWSLNFTDKTIIELEKADDILILTQENDYIDVLDQDGNIVDTIEQSYNGFLDSKIINSNLFLLFEDNMLTYSIDIDYNNDISFNLISSKELDGSTYNLLSANTTNVLVSIENQGFMIDNDKHVVSNTPSMDGYNTVAVLEDGSIAAVGTKLNDNQSVRYGGVLHYSEGMFINYIPTGYQEMYKIDSEDDFYTILANYSVGGKYSRSIIRLESNRIAFSNSGVSDTGSTRRGGVIIINLDSEQIENIFNSDNTETLGGMNGIYNSTWDSNYTIINEILNFGDKIYILNPYNELYGNVLSIYDQSIDSWEGIGVGNNALYLPQSLAIDKNGQIWIGFMNELTYYPPPGVPYSDGGIRFVNENNQFTEIDNDEILVGGEMSDVWSIDICEYDNFEILWVLSSEGVQGYTIFQNQLSPVSNIDLFSEIPFYKGDRIKCDQNSNVWITTTHSGVRTILANNNYTDFWPEYEGMTSDNSGLLSDIVYDIDFDHRSGKIYFATDNGISILHSPFSDISYKKNNKYKIYFDKNPFIVPQDETLVISNIPLGSTIIIMDLNGRALRKIKEGDFTEYIWDGKDSNGDYLNSGVYIVSATNSDNKNSVSKVAIIRNK